MANTKIEWHDMTPTDKHKILKHYIDTINDEGYGLTGWEQSFVEDVTAQFDESGTLSERQAEIVERIYVERVP